MILRQDKTLKAVANFIISSEDPLCDLKVHQDSDKMFFFPAYDCSEDPQLEKFVVKLGNAENGNKFKEAFLNARAFNKLVKEGKEKEAKWADVLVEEKESNNDGKKNEEKKEEKKDEKKVEEKVEENK